MHLINGINRDRIAAAWETFTKSEVIVEVGAVNGEVSHTSVASCKTHTATAVGRQAYEVGNVTIDSWCIHNLVARDVCNSTHLLIRELRSSTSYHHICQLASDFRHVDV